MQSCQEVEWAILRGSKLSVLGDVQAEVIGRCNSKVLRV